MLYKINFIVNPFIDTLPKITATSMRYPFDTHVNIITVKYLGIGYIKLKYTVVLS